jgi:catechol 2,3-dioxygenase-like lactoylglutathione lyase family enzyme
MEYAMGLRSIRNLDYTVIACADLHATRDFYRDVMHFPIDEERKNWVQFRVGGAILALRPRPEAAGAAVPGTDLQLAFRVPPAEINACHAELIAAGVTITRGPLDLPSWRHQALFFHDPEGTLIEIYAEY